MITVAEIQRATADDYGLPVETMTGPSRKAEDARPRQLAMYLTLTLTNKNLAHAGRLFRRDRKTVWHGQKRAEQRVITDRETREAARRIARAVLNGDGMIPFRSDWVGSHQSVENR